MGKATIQSGGEEGNYQITLDYGKAEQEKRVQALAVRIAALLPKITEAQTKYDTQKLKVDAAALLSAEAIDAYILATRSSGNQEDWKDELELFKQRQKTLFEEQAKAALLKIKIDELTAEKSQALKEKNYWDGLDLEVTQQAWCVDYTEDATGEVATVDVPGESTKILIAPGGAAPTDANGVLVAREVQDPNQVFFNAAILPGWQKFKPTYRIGVIDAIDLMEDTADVTLDAAKSSAQKLDINRYTDLPGIPVEYMTCNASSFEVGDKVVVQFENGEWNSAKVIGFAESPKPCWQLTLTGSLDFSTSQAMFQVYIENDKDALDILNNTGDYTIKMNGSTLPLDDRNGNDWIDWAIQTPEFRTYYTRFFGTANYQPCGKRGFIIVSNAAPSSLRLEIIRSDVALADFTVTPEIIHPTFEQDYNNGCNISPARWGGGLYATFEGKGVRKQEGQTFFKVNNK